MKDFWISVLEDLIFEHCDGQGLKPIISEYLGEDYRLELDPDGFTLYSNDDLSNDTLRFYIEDGKMFTSEPRNLPQDIGVEKYRSLEVVLKMVLGR